SMRVIDSEVDKRIGLSLKYLILAAYFQPFLVVLERTGEILQLTMQPADAVGHARSPEGIAIARRDSYRSLQCGQGLGHHTEISERQPVKKHCRQQQKTIAQFGSKLPRFDFTFDGALVVCLKKVEAAAPGQTGKQCRFVFDCARALYDVIQNRFALL